MAQQIASLDEEESKTGEHKDLYGTSLLDVLRPRVSGEIARIRLEDVETVTIRENLELLRGDVALSSIEDALAEAHIQRFSNKVHEKRTYVALGDLLSRYGEENGIDFILIDVGPSSGALTRSCFLASDAYFVPTAPDRFNVQAIGTLSSIIDRWIKEHRQIYEDFLELELPVKHGMPKFLGVILQNYKIFGGEPKPSYKMWMDRIPARVEENLFPRLRRYSSSDWDLTGGFYEARIVASMIRDFQSLAPLMQEHGKPIFEISPEDTKVMDRHNRPWSGTVWNSAVQRMEDYKSRIAELSSRMEFI